MQNAASIYTLRFICEWLTAHTICIDIMSSYPWSYIYSPYNIMFDAIKIRKTKNKNERAVESFSYNSTMHTVHTIDKPPQLQLFKFTLRTRT